MSWRLPSLKLFMVMENIAGTPVSRGFAAHDGEKFTVRLHVDWNSQVLDNNSNVTKEPFKNGGRECDFDRSASEEI